MEYLIKRGNASKRAKAELFSNETEYIERSAEDLREKARRERLRREMLGDKTPGITPDGTAPAAEPATFAGAEAPVIEPPKEEIPKAAAPKVRTPGAQTGGIPRVQTGTMPRVQTGSMPRVQTGSMPRVQTGTIPRVQTGQIPRVQTGTVPRVQTGSIPRVPNARNGETARFNRVAPERRGASDTARFTRPPQRTDRADGRTRKFDAVSAPEKTPTAEKRRGWVKYAAIAAALLLFAGALITVFALTGRGGDETPVVLPTDAVAGTEEKTDNVISAATHDAAGAKRSRVSFSFYGKPDFICSTPEGFTAGELMDLLGIDHGDGTRVSVANSEKISDGMAIDIKTVEHVTEYETEQIPYETEYNDTSSMYEGEEEVSVYGHEGVKTYTYECVLVNGVEESRTLVSEEVTTEPQNTVIDRGTAVYTPPAVIDNTPQTTYTGAPSEYLYYVDVRATCYYIVGITATGLPTGNNVMAVDPNVIPLGSKCIVIGELGDYGYRIAADVGGGIKGNIIDIWVPEGTGFGWQNARVYVLSEG